MAALAPDAVPGWLREGRSPTVFIHTPDNVGALELARRFRDDVRARVPRSSPSRADPLRTADSILSLNRSSRKVTGRLRAGPWIHADLAPTAVLRSRVYLPRHGAPDRFAAAAVRRLYREG